mmetsp:Transcript_9149/g.15594  ORF Transcript_9149/g.15594 Transcript_9149/m.15594 type:complete len:207 (-) Transcript_9149:812-1432(-)
MREIVDSEHGHGDAIGRVFNQFTSFLFFAFFWSQFASIITRLMCSFTCGYLTTNLGFSLCGVLHRFGAAHLHEIRDFHAALRRLLQSEQHALLALLFALGAIALAHAFDLFSRQHHFHRRRRLGGEQRFHAHWMLDVVRDARLNYIDMTLRRAGSVVVIDSHVVAILLDVCQIRALFYQKRHIPPLDVWHCSRRSLSSSCSSAQYD